MAAVDNSTRKLERRLQKLQVLLDHRTDFAEAAVNAVVVESIKTKMYAAGYSIRIIDNVEVRDVKIGRKKINYKIFNELLVGDGFDIATGREEGIRPHDIFGNPVLVWQGKTIIGTPTTVFAHHVKHPGVAASHIIRDTIRESGFEVQERYTMSVQNKIQEIRNSS